MEKPSSDSCRAAPAVASWTSAESANADKQAAEHRQMVFLSVLSQRTSTLLYVQDVSPVIVQIVFCDSRITIEPVSSHNCSSDAQFFHTKHLKQDSCFTWYGDDRYILIGHHAGGAALLHIEVRRLEKSPVETQRSRNVTGKFVTESLSHCSQIQSVDISLCHLNSNGTGVGRNLIMKTPQLMRTHTQGAGNTLLGDPRELIPHALGAKTHPVRLHTCDTAVRQLLKEQTITSARKEKTPGESYINSALQPFTRGYAES